MLPCSPATALLEWVPTSLSLRHLWAEKSSLTCAVPPQASLEELDVHHCLEAREDRATAQGALRPMGQPPVAWSLKIVGRPPIVDAQGGAVLLLWPRSTKCCSQGGAAPGAGVDKGLNSFYVRCD